jgi:hypothetical protein
MNTHSFLFQKKRTEYIIYPKYRSFLEFSQYKTLKNLLSSAGINDFSDWGNDKVWR